MDSEEHIFRLNKKIKELIALYEKTLTSNVEVEKVNEQLSKELYKYKEDHATAAKLCTQYKFDAERFKADRDHIFESHHKQKIKLNEVMKMCREQNDEINRLKRNRQGPLAYSVNLGTQSQVFAAVAPDRKSLDKIASLEQEVSRLQVELQESYELIDELEFDVEQIDYLEAENERLQEELTKVNVVAVDASHVHHDRHGCDFGCEHGDDAPHLVSHDGDDAVNRSAGDHTATADESQPQAAHDQPEQLVDKRLGDGDAAEEADRATRRDMLHKKLESLHEKHRSSDLFEKINARRSTLQ